MEILATLAAGLDSLARTGRRVITYLQAFVQQNFVIPSTTYAHNVQGVTFGNQATGSRLNNTLNEMVWTLKNSSSVIYRQRESSMALTGMFPRSESMNELCVVCKVRPAEVDGLCGKCYRWEENE